MTKHRYLHLDFCRYSRSSTFQYSLNTYC